MYKSTHFTKADIITVFHFNIMFCNIDTSCILSPVGRRETCFKSRKFSMTSWNAVKSNDSTAVSSWHEWPSLGLSCWDWKRESGSIGWGMYHDSVSGQTTDWAGGLEDTWTPVTMSGSILLCVQYLHKSFLRNQYGCTKVNSSIYMSSLKNQESLWYCLKFDFSPSFPPTFLSYPPFSSFPPFCPSFPLGFLRLYFLIHPVVFFVYLPPECWGYRCVIPWSLSSLATYSSSISIMPTLWYKSDQDPRGFREEYMCSLRNVNFPCQKFFCKQMNWVITMFW